ncbi:MAG: serine/threonine-protein phosphatase, partial [Deltaproteobacteria bacterium]|nr:serine/threonine-protein phosphatase [Deltaproteobacteria bacterium]
KDLQAAAGIQRSLLPKAGPEHKSFDFAWRYEPCVSVGGDIFNWLELNDGKIIAYLVDVSGHGVPAALVTVSVTQRIQQYISTHQNNFSPCSLLKTLNWEYPMERFDAYFTMTCTLFNHEQQKLTYASAGHPPPLLRQKNGSLIPLKEGAAPIGMGGIVPFTETTVTFAPGDLLFCYTDGLNEFANPEDEIFGFRRLQEALEKLHDATPQKLVDELYRELLAFGKGRQAEDDITMLAIKARG